MSRNASRARRVNAWSSERAARRRARGHFGRACGDMTSPPNFPWKAPAWARSAKQKTGQPQEALQFGRVRGKRSAHRHQDGPAAKTARVMPPKSLSARRCLAQCDLLDGLLIPQERQLILSQRIGEAGKTAQRMWLVAPNWLWVAVRDRADGDRSQSWSALVRSILATRRLG